MQRRNFLKLALGLLIQGSGITTAFTALAEDHLTKAGQMDGHIKDYLYKMRFFNHQNMDDIVLKDKEMALLKSTTERFKLIQRTIGHGNFHLISFDEALKVGRDYSLVGKFTCAEQDFLEKMFYRDAAQYGFLGHKPLLNLTDSINRKNVVRPHGSRQYLYKDHSLETYEKIKHDLGHQVILTSGLRGIPKQFLLFFNKACLNSGNLSLASRSLAPPGYSFHSIGDFDVGQADFGVANFSERFTTTRVYKNLVDLGYTTLRYERDNLLGVRFEPWHIKLT